MVEQENPVNPLRRLLIVNWRDIRNPDAGGAELHLQETARRLAASGVHCVLYAHHYPGASREETIDGIQVFRRGNRWLFNFTVLFCIHSWVRKHQPDIIIDDSNKIPFFLPWLTRVPVVVRIHHLFGSVIFRETGFLSALYVYMFEKLGSLAWRRASVITVSESTSKELSALGIKNTAIACNGVDTDVYFPVPSVQKNLRQILCIGRVKQYKKIDILIEAAAVLRRRFPDLDVAIAGSGDDIPRLKSLAERLGLAKCVRFTGYVSEEEKVFLLRKASAAVNTSLKEGWGLTVIEANACGTVVVASDVPGLRDSIKNGETGFLVPPENSAVLAEKLMLLLENGEVRERMEKNALAWAREHSWQKTFETTRQVLLSRLERE